MWFLPFLLALVLAFASLQAQTLVDVSFSPQVSVQRFVAFKKSMFVVANEGVFRTDNRGTTWQRVTINGTSATAINTYQTTLYARTDKGLFHSMNDGVTWSSTTADLTGEFVEVGKTLYALRGSPSRGSSYAKVVIDGKLFYSTTAGVTWSEVDFSATSFMPTPIAAIASYDGKIFIATNTQLNTQALVVRILYSADGKAWKNLGDGLTSGFLARGVFIGGFAIANNRLFAFTINGNRLYTADALGLVGENVYALDSSMQSWQVLTPKLQVNTLTSCGAALIGGGNITFRGGNGAWLYSGGLFGINPLNRTWRSLTQGFGQPCAGDFAPGEIKTTCLNVEYPTFDSDGYLYLYNVLFPNTYQILRSAEPLCNPSVAVQILSTQPIALPPFPNPAQDQASITYTLTRSSYVRAEIFTSFGHIVRSVFEGEQIAGKHTLTLDISDLATGVYCCRIQTESGVQTNFITITR